MPDLPRWLKHATVWLLISGGLFLAVQAWLLRQAASSFTVDGNVVEIRRRGDGHYHWPGQVGGRSVDFLVDTGATRTAIPAALAQELGLASVGSVRSMTAGGEVAASVVVADLQLEGGLRAERLRLMVLPDLQAPLLGMDVLGKLRWQQSPGVLRVDLRRNAD